MDNTNNGGFDTAEVQRPDGSLHSMSRSAYEAIPLSERISLVLRRQVEFYRNGVKIPPHQAMKL